MTPGDIARVLAKAAAFDQRTVGAADVAAWHEAVGDLEVGDALAAVTRHYSASTQRIMPVHVRDIVRDRLARDVERLRATATCRTCYDRRIITALPGCSEPCPDCRTSGAPDVHK